MNRAKCLQCGGTKRITYSCVCPKLAISFWDYLGARLKIPDTDRVPWLPDLIRQNAPV